MAKPSSILIVTVSNDIHSEAVSRRVNELSPGSCVTVCIDTLSAEISLIWATPELSDGTHIVANGQAINLRDLKVIWWRRTVSGQLLDKCDEASKDFIDRGCVAALRGLLLSSFEGRWISHPVATEVASNKLVQLAAARDCGFHVPPTLVSDDPVAVERFCSDAGCPVIVKPVVGTPKEIAFTQRICPADLSDVTGISVVPSIYQHEIEGTRHLRINVFGDEILAASIVSPDLDWRPDLRVPIQEVAIEKELKDQLLQVLRRLNLAMGVFDIKFDATDVPHWIEVNPQGQFLFLEGIAGLPLIERFSEYLLREAGISVVTV